MIVLKEISIQTYSIEIIPPKHSMDEDRFLEALDLVLSKEQFVLLFQTKGEQAFSLEGKKKLSIWYKDNKDILAKKCQALARVTEKPIDQKKILALQKAFPFPYQAFPSKNQALSWAISKRSG
jgi:hypothetical protein